MEKLGPVGITIGDTMKGLWKTVSDGLNLGSVFSTLKDWAVTAFEAVLTAGKYAVAILYAGWVGGFNAIRITWTALPGVVGEAAVGAANLAISGIEYLANKAIAALNWLAEWVNPVLDRVGLATITRIESVALPRMENSFAGSTARMGAQVRDEFASAFGDAMGMMDAFSARWRENSIAAAKARLAAKAKEIRGDNTDRASSAKGPKETEAERALQSARDFAANLALETAKIGKTPIEIKRMEVAMAALKAPTDEARIAIGRGWHRLLSDDRISVARRAATIGCLLRACYGLCSPVLPGAIFPRSLATGTACSAGSAGGAPRGSGGACSMRCPMTRTSSI